MQRGALRRFESADVGNHVRPNAPRIFPGEVLERALCDIFRRAIEGLADGVVAMVRPVAGENFIGAAPEQQGEVTRDDLSDRLAADLVPERHAPPAVREAVARI